MRVLIADKLPGQGIEQIRSMGIPVDVRPDLTAEDLPQAVADVRAEILVVRSTRVQAEVFAHAPSLGLVIRAGAGTNTIDVAAANRYGVFVCNCPGKNAIAVAELAMGLMLCLDRQIPEADRQLKAGRWNKKAFGQARGLHGQRLGLVGFGHVAQELAARALAFGMYVEVLSAHLDAKTANSLDVELAPDLDTLLHRCDILSVHTPYSKSTHHLIGARELALLKPGSVVIHTARGGIVDDSALAAAVSSGHLRAGLDVLEGEPSGSDVAFASPLCESTNVCATPHIGASTEQAELATATEVARIIAEYLRRGTVEAALNLDRDTDAKYTVVVRHRDRVGVLAGVLGALRAEDLNVQQMHNVVFDGHETACASIRLDREPSAGLLTALRGQADVLAVDIRAVRT